MKTLINFGLQEAYKQMEKLGDRLGEIESMIDWRSISTHRARYV
jgi:hypothetical protein